MNSRSARIALQASAAAAALALAPAQGAPSAEAERWMTLRFTQSLYGDDVSDVYTRLMPAFAQADLDGNGISRSDDVLAEELRMAQQRASQVAQILRDDLNSDGQVTRAEVKRARSGEARRSLSGAGVQVDPTPEQTAEILAKLIDRAMKPDANNDGTITLPEMLAQSNEQAQRLGESYRSQRAIPTSLDANGDGTITRAEFKALIDFVFDATDTNRDDRLSPEERALLKAKSARLQQEENTARQAERQSEQAREAAANCGLPAISKTAKLALVSAYEGQALSTVALGGDEEEVTVARVVVEPGREPLALVLTSHTANIWQIEGDVGRLASVLVSSTTGDGQKAPRAGVVGVSRDKVSFAKSNTCLRWASTSKDEMPPREANRLTQELGRKPDAMFATYGLATIAMPSGTLDKTSAFRNTVAAPADPSAASVWKVMLTYNPKGVVDVEPSSVVAATKVAKFAVLPQEAGLAQLVQARALEVTGSVRIVKVGTTSVQLSPGDDSIRGAQGADMEVSTVPNEYTIKSQITFPAGLGGAHGVKFILPAGVPEPKGSPGHSEVMRVGR